MAPPRRVSMSLVLLPTAMLDDHRADAAVSIDIESVRKHPIGGSGQCLSRHPRRGLQTGERRGGSRSRGSHRPSPTRGEQSFFNGQGRRALRRSYALLRPSRPASRPRQHRREDSCRQRSARTPGNEGLAAKPRTVPSYSSPPTRNRSARHQHLLSHLNSRIVVAQVLRARL